MAQHLVIDWTLTPELGGLRVSYTVRNEGDAAVWLLDQPIGFGDTSGFVAQPERFGVRIDGDVVVASRGWVPSQQQVMVPLYPGARKLAPGAALASSGTLPLPLSAYHPNDGEAPLESAPASIRLDVGYLVGAPGLVDRPVGDATLRVPTREAVESQAWLSTAPRALPSPRVHGP